MIPFQIAFVDFPESDSVWLAVQKRVEKLGHFCDRIIRCEIRLSCPHQHEGGSRLYHVHIHVALPGSDIVVSQDPSRNGAHHDIYVAIRDAFNAAERMVQDKVRIMRNEIKTRHKKSEDVPAADDSYYEEEFERKNEEEELVPPFLKKILKA